MSESVSELVTEVRGQVSVSVQFSQIYFMKDYMMGPLQMPKIMSSYEADRLLC